MKELHLTTPRLRIVTFSEKHLTARYVSWLNDPEVVRYSEQRHKRHTLESCRAYFESFEGTPNMFLAIEKKEDGKHIGNINVYFDTPNNTADMGIIIGEKAEWGRGYASEAWNAVISHLLATGIRKITAGTMASNKAMLALMKKAGMVPDGTFNRQFLWEGDEIDMVHFAIFGHAESQGGAS